MRQHGEDGKALAGGQSLVPLMNMRLSQPSVLIDLNRLPELVRLEAGRESLCVGAMTRQAAVERWEAVDGLPLLAEAIRWIGHPQIRNRGTVGGSIVHADPAAELPVVFLALDGEAQVNSSRGERTIPAADFFVYTMTTSLEPDELLTEVRFPCRRPAPGRRFSRWRGDTATSPW
jgi:CO/xanthine dehydrogenase FAD-binding subunit